MSTEDHDPVGHGLPLSAVPLIFAGVEAATGSSVCALAEGDFKPLTLAAQKEAAVLIFDSFLL